MVEGASTSLVFSFGFFFGGLAQFVAGLLEYQRKNTFGTVAFCCYGAFWMAVALDGTLRTAGVYTGVDLKGEQMMLSLWGILTFILWLCTFSMNVAISSLFFTLSLLFWFLAGGQKNATLLKFAGGWGILVSAIAFYCALAALMEDCYNKPILPTWPLKAINNVQLHNIGTKRNIEVDEV